MGIFDRWFGRGGEPRRPVRDLASLAQPLARPAALVVKSNLPTGSYFRGTPALPAGTAWPSKAGTPLTFLACIDLASLREVVEVGWLPASGRLLFFYDVDNQPWGSEPSDRGGWAVIHTGVESAAPANPSPGLPVPREHVSFRRIESLPSSARPEVAALALDEAEAEVLDELRHERCGDAPCHQIGGFPLPVQGDEMEDECRRASGAGTEHDSGDWRLLLQIDSDGDLMWGDAGMLYFWIRERDARAGRFDHVWLVLQCY